MHLLARKRAKSSIWYADSGDTKTSQIGYFAKWLFETTGKRTRLVSSDGGGWAPIEDRGLMHPDIGIVEGFDISSRSLIYGDIHRIADGFWPTIIDGKRVFQNIEQCRTTPQEWQNIGAYAIEGIKSLSRCLLSYMSTYKDGAGERLYKVPFVVEEGGYETAGTDKGHYGVVHTVIHNLIVQRFSKLPVDYIIYTSLVGKGKEKSTKDAVLGPECVGDALTADLPQWVGDCLHFARQQVTLKSGATKEIVVSWFQKHTDPNSGFPYLAKCRLVPELYPKMLEKFPNGFVPLTFDKGIRNYYEFTSELEKQAVYDTKSWYSEVIKNRNNQ